MNDGVVIDVRRAGKTYRTAAGEFSALIDDLSGYADRRVTLIDGRIGSAVAVAV